MSKRKFSADSAATAATPDDPQPLTTAQRQFAAVLGDLLAAERWTTQKRCESDDGKPAAQPVASPPSNT